MRVRFEGERGRMVLVWWVVMGKFWMREVGRCWDLKGCVEVGGGGRGLWRGLKGGDGVDGG